MARFFTLGCVVAVRAPLFQSVKARRVNALFPESNAISVGIFGFDFLFCGRCFRRQLGLRTFSTLFPHLNGRASL
jgi:hypothetical protein